MRQRHTLHRPWELFDTHCHIQSIGALNGEKNTQALWAKVKDQNPDAVLQRAYDKGVMRMICVGCNYEDSKLAVEFVNKYDNCWASIGIHPHEADLYVNSPQLDDFASLAPFPKVVAIGECGLDYHYEHSSKKDQIEILKFHIELALKYNLPIIFHIRDAYDDFWPVFEAYWSKGHAIRGVLHSFTDTVRNLERALKYGLFIGANGIATFTKSAEQLEMYRSIPIDNLLLETDAPFLTPVPERGTICEPYHIRTIAEFLVRLRNESIEDLAVATTRNARTIFGV